MQFRFKRHGVETTKSEEAWNQWIKRTRLQTVHLLVYQYGLAITKSQDLQELKKLCIQPPQIYKQLITQAPPDYVAPMLNAARLEQHLASLYRSAQLALDCMTASIADNALLQSGVGTIGRRLDRRSVSKVERRSSRHSSVRFPLLPVTTSSTHFLQSTTLPTLNTKSNQRVKTASRRETTKFCFFLVNVELKILNRNHLRKLLPRLPKCLAPFSFPSRAAQQD
ncbi:hypothetical protein JG687_00019618 [Phytophthora cactorum]|uniref:Uncharacterized protein n=1 Tax=Phytophthora cactorum TaxID=29920 RepID=A0A8T1TIS4_9STRA|nr:hypothetical protein JG687_00019618 [Phytophthora cactorum]